MTTSGYIQFLLTAALVVAFFGAPESVADLAPAGTVAALRALDDGSAVLGWDRPRQGIVSRERADGTVMWAQLVPGEIEDNAVQIAGDAVVVKFRRGRVAGIAVYSLDGALRWQGTLHEYKTELEAREMSSVGGAAAVGAWFIERYYVDGDARLIALRRSDGQRGWDRDNAIDGGVTPEGRDHFVIAGPLETREYDAATGDWRRLAEGCVIGERYVTATQLGVADIVACGRYRGRDVWIVRTATGGALVEKTPDGTIVLEHSLPRIRWATAQDDQGEPWSRIGVSGELSRYVPLTADEGTAARAMLVDLETGETVGRSERDDNVAVLRDGEASYALVGFTPRIAAFDLATHGLRTFHRGLDPSGVSPGDVGGGLLWTHSNERTLIDAPDVRAIRL